MITAKELHAFMTGIFVGIIILAIGRGVIWWGWAPCVFGAMVTIYFYVKGEW